MKYYEFKYDSKTIKLIGLIYGIIQNLVYPQMYCFIIVCIYYLFHLNKYIPAEVTVITYIVSVIIGIILAFRLVFSKKGVFLSDSFFEIARYTISRSSPVKQNLIIHINEIEMIGISYQNLRYTRNFRKLLILCGSRSSYVVITLKNGVQYFFALEDQEDFVSEVRKRIDTLADKKKTAE